MSEPEMPYRRHGSSVDYEGLQKEVRALVHRSEYEQQELAEELDVTRSAIAKAVNYAGPKFEKLQTRIIEYLSDYSMVKEVDVTFRHVRKDRAEEDGHEYGGDGAPKRSASSTH